MEEFLPSEIARAVYGYLLLEGCEAAANTFLETSPNLVECKQRIKCGKRLTPANTLLLGKNLVEVLNVACTVHSVVKQIHDKQKRNNIADCHESLTELLDQLRNCLESDSQSISKAEENSSSQLTESQSLIPSPTYLRTPSRGPSLAENYQTLVQECSEVFDLTPPTEKPVQKNGYGESPSKDPLHRPTSAPGALGLSQLDMDNESAIAAITGMGDTVAASAAVTSASNSHITDQHMFTVPQIVGITPISHMPQVSTSPSICTTMVSSCQVMTSNYNAAQYTAPSINASDNSQLLLACDAPKTDTAVGTCSLPDPPIFILDNQDQCEASDMTASYLNMPPCAASTPQNEPVFRPEDTAIIIYPPMPMNLRPKKVKAPKEKRNLRRSGRLRKLLPKPPRQDPPHILHINILPQTIEEKDEDVDDPDEVNSVDNEMELAKQLPNSDEKDSSDNESNIQPNKTCEIEEKQKNDGLLTTSDKENVSDENILNEKSAEKLCNNLTNECDKESTPKPPALRKNISRSTPRRNSHVRALCFNTPNKPTSTRKSNTSPKMPKIKISPHSAKLSCVKRSSLFSPLNKKDLSNVSEEEAELGQKKDTETSQDSSDESPLCKLPIATRSPAPKLSSAWQEVIDIKSADKPIWDEKIRSFANGDFEDPPPPPKKGQCKKTNANMSPKKEIKSSVKNTVKAVLKSDIKSSNCRKSSRLQKDNSVNLETSDLSKTNTDIGLIEASPQITNIPANSKKKQAAQAKNKLTKNKNNKLSVPKFTRAKFRSLSTVTNVSQDSLNDEELDSKDISEEEISDMTASNKEQEVDDSVANDKNVLLEDLVVSSNSCFAQGEEVINNASDRKELISPLHDNNSKESVLQSNHPEKIDSIKSSSPTFIQPNAFTETPLKDFGICGPKIHALSTPLIKSIRQETSVLEEDLLLTPSLPPTPQLNCSSRNSLITPCKPITEPIDKLRNCTVKILRNIKNENNSTHTENAFNESSEKGKAIISSCEGKSNFSSDSSLHKLEDKKYASNSCLSNQTHIDEDDNIHKTDLNRSFRLALSTTDVSEDEVECHLNHSGDPLLESDKVQKKNTIISRNDVYSTESSDDEIKNINSVITKNSPAKTKLTELAAMLLESERKSLNKKSKRIATNRRNKKSIKKSSPNSTGSGSSIIYTSQEIKKSMKTRKKGVKKKNTLKKRCEKIEDVCPEINICTKETNEKTVTPEKIRQQLQSDLLKRERQIIFGDAFPSSSDSDTDIEVFEKKKTVINKPKSKKVNTKLLKSNEIVISDCSVDDFPQDFPRPGKYVTFGSENKKTYNEMLNSPNAKKHLSEKNNIEESYTKNSNCCMPVDIVKPRTISESGKISDSLALDSDPQNKSSSNNNIQDNVQKPDVSPLKMMELANKSGQNTPVSNCDVVIKGVNNQFRNNMVEQHFEKGEIGSSSDSSFKTITMYKSATKVGYFDGLINEHISEADCSSDKVGLVDKNSKGADTNLLKDGDKGTNVSFTNAIQKITNNILRPSSPYNLDSHCSLSNVNEVESECLNKEDSEAENEICVTSTSTAKKMDSFSSLNLLDLDRRDTFQVDEGKVTLTYSQTIHLYRYCPLPSKNIEKKRVKLTPIEDDKYEQKLQVDYDIVDGEVINSRGDRRPSSEADVLECSTSSILSDIVPNNNQISVKIDTLNLRNEQETKSEIQNSKIGIENTYLKNTNIRRNSACQNEHKNTATAQALEKSPDEESRPKRHVCETDTNRELKNESRASRSHKMYQTQQELKRETLNKIDRHRLRHERRRDRNEYVRGDRSYSRRDCDRRYPERYRRRDYRRDYSEKRNNYLHEHSRRGCLTNSEKKIQSSKRSPTDHEHYSIEKLKEHLSRIEERDLDRVDFLKESKMTETEEIVDPRAAQVLTYSDVERNDSSRDEAESLMDFAIMTKTKDKRPPETLPKDLCSTSTNIIKSDSSDSNKRKLSRSIGESSEACNVEKKLKLGEVEMKEAKNVLKHKMTDMLNVLHPDTSNEAS